MRNHPLRHTGSGMGPRILPGLALALSLGVAGSAHAAGGDVMVGGVTPGGDLRITGDSGDNDFTVTQNADGTVTVTGNNGTTINGQGSHTTTAPVTGELDVRGLGGDDKITVDGVNNVDDIDIRDDQGTNEIEVKNSKTKDKLKVVNNAGTIKIGDSSWGRRDIRPGSGSVTPANLNGRGGAGSVGTPPSGGGGGGDKGVSYDKTAGPRDAIQRGQPTNNPAQQGIIDAPRMPQSPSRRVPNNPSRSYPKPKVRN